MFLQAWVGDPDAGRLLPIEQMLPPTVDGSTPPHVYVDDLNSIVSLGGRLRSEPVYRALLDAADFDLGVHPLSSAPGGYVLLDLHRRRPTALMCANGLRTAVRLSYGNSVPVPR